MKTLIVLMGISLCLLFVTIGCDSEEDISRQKYQNMIQDKIGSGASAMLFGHKAVITPYEGAFLIKHDSQCSCNTTKVKENKKESSLKLIEEEPK